VAETEGEETETVKRRVIRILAGGMLAACVTVSPATSAAPAPADGEGNAATPELQFAQLLEATGAGYAKLRTAIIENPEEWVPLPDTKLVDADFHRRVLAEAIIGRTRAPAQYWKYEQQLFDVISEASRSHAGILQALCASRPQGGPSRVGRESGSDVAQGIYDAAAVPLLLEVMLKGAVVQPASGARELERYPMWAQCCAAVLVGKLKHEAVVPALLEALTTGKQMELRACAATGLAHTKSREAVDPLINALADPAPPGRESAAWALGAIGDRRATEALVAMTREDKESAVRYSAVMALKDIADPAAAEALMEDLHSPDPSARVLTIDALLGLKDARCVPSLIAVLQNDTYSTVRQRAAFALGYMEDLRAVPVLVEGLRDKDSIVQRIAAENLARFDDLRATEALIAALQDANMEPGIRRTTAHALAKKDDPRVIEALLSALKDKDSSIRQSAAEALARSKDAKSVPALIEMLDDPSEDVQKASALALSRMEGDPRALEALTGLARDKDRPDIRRHAVLTLRFLKKEPAALEAIMVALKANEPAVREAALMALWGTKEPRAVDAVLAVLKKDDDPALQEKAALLLGQMGDLRAVSTLIGALGNEDVNVRISSTRALAALKDPSTVPALINALGDENADVRTSSAWALGVFKDPRAIEPLRAALKDDDANVRANAAGALEKIQGEKP
jgi:HEAT repeat protein